MPRPLRAVNWQSRKFLLAEFNRLCRQERTPNEQMIERFLQCEQAQTASRIVASVSGANKHHREQSLQTPAALLPWLH
jgi:hypothetical protein